MKREIIIIGDDETEEMRFEFVVNGESVQFGELPENDVDEFAAMIQAFTHYFIDIEALAALHVINPN